MHLDALRLGYVQSVPAVTAAFADGDTARIDLAQGWCENVGVASGPTHL